MSNLFDALSSTTINTIVTILGIVIAVTPYLIITLRAIRHRITKRQILRFWKGFTKTEIKIAFTEYVGKTLTNISMDLKDITGDTRLFSLGIGFAISHLQSFIDRSMPNSKLKFVGQEPVHVGKGQFIVIGTPEPNRITKFFFNILREEYVLPFDIYTNTNQKRIEIKHGNNTYFGELDNDKNGKDYSLVVKFQHNGQWIILIMASLTYGSFEGARSITNPRIIQEVLKVTKKADCFAFIIKTRVFENKSLGPELELNSITILKLKQQSSA